MQELWCRGVDTHVPNFQITFGLHPTPRLIITSQEGKVALLCSHSLSRGLSLWLDPQPGESCLSFDALPWHWAAAYSGPRTPHWTLAGWQVSALWVREAPVGGGGPWTTQLRRSHSNRTPAPRLRLAREEGHEGKSPSVWLNKTCLQRV